MILDVNATTLIRAGSGLVYVALGLAIAFVATRQGADRRLGFGLAIHAIGFGASFVVSNFFKATGAREALAYVGGLAASWALAVAGLIIVAPRLHTTRRTTLAAIGAAVAVTGATCVFALANQDLLAGAVSVSALPPDLAPLFVLDVSLIGAGRGMAIAIAILLAPKALTSPAPRTLALALIVYPAMYFGQLVALYGRVPGIGFFGLANLVGTLAVTVAWLAAVGRGAGRPGILVALAGPAFCLLAQIEISIAHEPTALVGIVRLAAAVALGIAIFRHDLLGARIGGRASDRATVATVAVATLFIVAQIAQNFLAAQYGLLMGGVVAGAFLFAASPLQRAMERMGAKHEDDHAPSGRAAISASSDDEIYRAALRVALRDKRLTRDEEIQLHRLATRLGISGERAHAMLVEVEREMGVT